jgi:hypothetical protein
MDIMIINLGRLREPPCQQPRLPDAAVRISQDLKCFKNFDRCAGVSKA